MPRRGGPSLHAMIMKEVRDTSRMKPKSDGDFTHKWHVFMGLECCQDCGIVRRRDRQNKPCKGKVGIALRAEPAPDANRRFKSGSF